MSTIGTVVAAEPEFYSLRDIVAATGNCPVCGPREQVGVTAPYARLGEIVACPCTRVGARWLLEQFAGVSGSAPDGPEGAA